VTAHNKATFASTWAAHSSGLAQFTLMPNFIAVNGQPCSCHSASIIVRLMLPADRIFAGIYKNVSNLVSAKLNFS